MNIEVEPQANCYCRLIVTLSQDEVDARYDKATRKVAKGAHLPGFRPGKLPKALLARHFAPQIDQEAADFIVQETLWPAITERQLQLVERPVLESISIKRGATGRYVATVELYPTLPKVQVERLAAPYISPKVGAGQIDARIESERKSGAVTVPCTERSTIEKGDFVLADYQGFDDGQAIGATKQSDQLLEIAPGKYLPGFVEGLIGRSVPGEAKISITFPTDYGYEPLAGKQVEFRFQLRELKVEELPAIDDDFAKDRGHADLAAMRATIEAELQRSADADAARQNEQALLLALVAANPFELSTGIVDRQTEAMLADREQRLKELLGQAYALSDDDRIDLRTSLREEAEQMVRIGMLVEEIAKQQAIEVTDQAVDERIDTLQHERVAAMKARGDDSAAALDELLSPQARDRVRHQLMHARVVALLQETAERLPPPPPSETAKNQGPS